jgi:hypothetical protein
MREKEQKTGYVRSRGSRKLVWQEKDFLWHSFSKKDSIFWKKKDWSRNFAPSKGKRALKNTNDNTFKSTIFIHTFKFLSL